MLIDWFTIAAQVLNFLILVWLMKRFLYKPILDAIDAREERIAAKIADADAKKADAEKAHETFQEKNVEIDRQRDAMLHQAEEEAQAERRRLIDEARQAADALRAQRQVALEREQQHLNDEITRRTRKEVFAITRKTLTDLAGTTLEERMSETFTRRLREIDGEEKAGLGEALGTASDPALVRSAFDLSPEQKTALQEALEETFALERQVRFETAPEVISGIELIANGRKVAWSIADYLASLEASVEELLKGQFKPQSQPEAEADTRPEPEPKSGRTSGAHEEAP